MLKKFNIFAEEILDDMKLDFRFKRGSRYLAHNLNKSEKQTLNKKYNEIVKSTLKDLEGTDQRVRICHYTGDNTIRTEFGYIKEVKDDVVNWTDSSDKEKTTPVDFIIIDKVYDEIWKDEDELKAQIEQVKLDNQSILFLGAGDIYQKAKNKDGALKFALYFTNEENQIEFSKLTGVLPTNINALKHPYFQISQNDTAEEKARIICAKQLENVQQTIITTKNKKELNTLSANYIQEILIKKNDIKTTLDKFAEDWKKL